MFRSPSWSQVERWRAHWDVARVSEVQSLLNAGATDEEITCATGRPGIAVKKSGGAIFKPDLRGLDLALIPLGERHLFKPKRKDSLLNAFLDGARLTEADLSNLNMSKARMKKVTLRRANFSGSNLQKAKLEDADLRDTNLCKANLAYISYTRDQFSRKGTIFMETDLRDAEYVDPVLARDADDQFHLYVLKHRASGKPMAKAALALWRFSSDYGRSLVLWLVSCFYLISIFALKFYSLGPDYFSVPHLEFSISSMYYYSVVTFTTLGFGDIIPRNATAAWWMVTEVFSGYMMLGGLVAIFGQRLARLR